NITTGSVTSGQWHHVVAIYRSNGLCEIWVDGVLRASATINFTISTNGRSWKLANAYEYGGGADTAAFSGKLSEAALYWSALSSTRIQAHYQAMGQLVSGRPTLTRVDYPDGSAKIYHYENTNFPYYLTGISLVEPSGTTTRFS